MKEELLQQVLKEAPVLAECVEKDGEKSLLFYCEQLISQSKRTGEVLEYYPTKDVGEAVKEYLSPLVGDKLAESMGEQLKSQRLLLTANHHEAEFCVQSVQGNLLYSYILEKMGYSRLVPVFSNTTVNMSNGNFPRGLLVYHTSSGMLKLPIFPFKERNTLVAAAGGFTEEMVEKTLSETIRYQKNGTLTEETASIVKKILQECYLNEKVLKEERYAKQVLHINRSLTKKMQKDETKELLYIEMEEISSRLFQKDLISEENPLLRNLLFCQPMTEKLIRALDKKTGCWEQGTQRGTFLFWGVDERKRRFSLSLRREGGKSYLWGMDMEKKEYRYEYDQKSILSALEKKQLVPGLFLTFFELYLTRDFVLAGGCFQSIYLKEMCEGLVKVLETEKGYEKELEILQKKESLYLSGPMFLVSGNEKAYPMGTVEILECGGIAMEKLSDFLDISVKKAHEIGLFNFYPDLIPAGCQKENWWQKLSEEIGGIV